MKTINPHRKAIEAASLFRKNNSAHIPSASGYITVEGNIAGGWISDLSRPGDCPPGCLAISVGGDIYQAVGGSYWPGAEHWALISRAPTATPQEAIA